MKKVVMFIGSVSRDTILLYIFELVLQREVLNLHLEITSKE